MNVTGEIRIATMDGTTKFNGDVGPRGAKGDKGEQGNPGPANTLQIGTVESGTTASATITGTSPNQTLNLVLPKGEKGDDIQYETMPTASATYVDKIIEYVGTTDANYTNGYFYKCIASNEVTDTITATQTDNGVTLGTINIDNATLKSRLQPGTYEFENRGYPTKIRYSNLGIPFVTLDLTRDSVFDRQAMIPGSTGIYSWVDDSNNFYVTTTKKPAYGTKLYSLDINTNETTDTGYTFVSSSEPSPIDGYWVLKQGNSYTEIEPYEYGILMSSSGLPGNKISVTYTSTPNSYSWQRIDTQPNAVSSVNGKVGAVTLNASDVGAVATETGKGLSTNDYDNTEKANVASNTSARHTHANKALIDTYAQSEADLSDAVSKKHEHSNKTILDNTTASYTTTDKTKLDNIDMATKQDTLVSGTNIKTINDQSILGSGNIVIQGGGGTSDYTQLTNKPQINSVTLTGNKTLADLGIINFSGNYNDLTNKPTIPTKTSDLTNDSGFIDNTYHDNTKVDTVAGKGLSTNDYDNTEKGNVASNTAARHTHSNKSTLDNTTASYTTEEKTKLAGVENNANNYTLPTSSTSTLGGVKVDGSTVTINANGVISAVSGLQIEVVQTLPATGDTNKIYLVPKTATTQNVYNEYLYVNNAWEKIGTTEVDLSNYYTKTEADTLLGNKVDKVNGKGLSTNDYDATEKGNVASNTAARHTHSNKSILDNTTASYTTSEQTKLSGIESGAQVNTVTSVNGNTGAITLNASSVGALPNTTPTVTMTITFSDDTTATYSLYGSQVV